MKLDIPDYQRSYKWVIQNIEDLISDITNAISDADRYRTEFKYRIGTIIVHKTESKNYDVLSAVYVNFRFILLQIRLVNHGMRLFQNPC